MEEDKNNIVHVCEGCSKKIYPRSGKIRPISGDHVKVRFTEKGYTEYMWVDVVKVFSKTFEGILDNDPVAVTSLELHDEVTCKIADIVDLYDNDRVTFKDQITIESKVAYN